MIQSEGCGPLLALGIERDRLGRLMCEPFNHLHGDRLVLKEMGEGTRYPDIKKTRNPVLKVQGWTGHYPSRFKEAKAAKGC